MARTWRDRGFLLQTRTKAIPLPLAVLVAGLGDGPGCFAAMGYYNWRVFGNPLTLPYTINRATYAVAPLFVWQNLRPEPVYRHKEIRDFYVSNEVADFCASRALVDLSCVLPKIGIAGAFFFAAALLPPLIMLPIDLLRSSHPQPADRGGNRQRGPGGQCFLLPRYSAPVTGILYVVMLQCMRHFRTLTVSGEPVGRFVMRIIPVVCLLAAGLRVAAQPLHIQLRSLSDHVVWTSARSGFQGRRLPPTRRCAWETPADSPLRAKSRLSRRVGLQ